MKIFPRDPITEDKTFVSVTAINRGTAPTTITHFCGFYSATLWNLIQGKRQEFFIKTGNQIGDAVPYILKPGEEWHSTAYQENLQNLGNGYLFIGILHNQRKRPVYKRVRFQGIT